MKPIFEDLWVLTSSGVVVFDHVVDVQLKSQLFGALMSALNSFAEQLAEGGLSNFELSEKRFIIMKKNDFLFVASTTKKVKEKTVIDQLDNISSRSTQIFLKIGTKILVFFLISRKTLQVH